MVNINGTSVENTRATLAISNRGFNYGDAVFETIKTISGKILFWEDHYFRLMASMRIMRMEIPMRFTPEFLESEIKALITANALSESACRIKLIVNRAVGGYYTPNQSGVEYMIMLEPLSNDLYLFNDGAYEVDLFKDYYVSPDLLSTIKTNNRAINVVGSIYAEENSLQNCLLLNSNKLVVESLNANLFLVKGKIIKTPPIIDGCLKGVLRKQLIDIIELLPEYHLEEASISPFELQQADELFLTNVIVGVQSVTKYRKKQYENDVAKALLAKLNLKVRLS
ncbi:MAG: aminotransferase class IV [Flavobacteriaceae bacterium]|nr:aminotransferase class IV [Flavobacteriaceae bacterium]